MPSSPGFRGIARTLRQRTFRIYIAGNAVSLVGTWTQRVAVGWLTWELTGSAVWLGIVACAELLPTVLLGPFGGVLADRMDRLRIMKLTQALALCQAALLAALTAAGVMTAELLAALVLISGIAVGFNQPARLATMHALVPPSQLATAIAINSVAFNLARFLGPALAGLLIVSVGVAAAFAVNALSFLAFLVALSRLRLAPQEIDGTRRAPVLTDLREGMGYAVRHPGIGPMLALLTVASLGVRPFVELMPGFAAQVFDGGAGTLALLTSTVGAGAVVGGLWVAQRGNGDGLTRVVLLAIVAQALAILGFVASDLLWVAVIAAALAGMAMVAGAVSMQTLMQLAVEGSLRGRVLSFYGIIFIGGPAAGALLLGGLSEALGLRAALGGGALLTLAIWSWMWRRRGRIAAALESDSA